MPVIHFYGPQMEKERKEELVRDFTDAASRATGIPKDRFVIYLHEMDSENIGVGPILLANRK
jgi:4-oxalocrotonate tautomerase